MGKHKNFGDWSPTFLAALAECGNVSDAAKAAGITRTVAYHWRDKESAAALAFKEAWDAALEEACDSLEREARRRAVEGTDRPVFYQGDQCGTIREYSDSLLSLLLRAHRPEKFSERYRMEHTGKDGGPIEQSVVILPDNGRNDRA